MQHIWVKFRFICLAGLLIAVSGFSGPHFLTCKRLTFANRKFSCSVVKKNQKCHLRSQKALIDGKSFTKVSLYPDKKATYAGKRSSSSRQTTKGIGLSKSGGPDGVVVSAGLKILMILFFTSFMKFGTRAYIKQWVRVEAGRKFVNSGGWFGIYATIPLIAGIVNMITNKISVWMIFNPVKYAGVELVKRPEGSPLGAFGWQGIVPARVSRMGPNIAETLVSLVDLKRIFSRMDSSKLASVISPQLEPLVDRFVRNKLKDPETNPLLMSFPSDSNIYTSFSNYYKTALSTRLQRAVQYIIEQVQIVPEKYLDLQGAVVDTLLSDKRIICALFQACGKRELVFIVNFGLLGGFFFGLLQMAAWLVWSPSWSLALGGAIAGYLTNFIALAVMFRPVNPINIANVFMVQGLFLKRQREVSRDFADLACKQLLSSEQLLIYLCHGRRKNTLTDLIEFRLRKDLDWLLPAVPDKEWRELATAVQNTLPRASEGAYSYMEDSLRLREEITAALVAMPAKDFETVLHPIFEEDENTLIGVGTVLGAAAGAAQAALY